LQAAEDLINSMDLMDAEEDNQGNRIEALKPSRTYHPVLQYFYTCLHHRALYPNDPIPQPDPLILKYCYPEKHEASFYSKLIKRSENVLNYFAEQFSLKRNERSSILGKRKYWFASDLNNEVNLDSYNMASASTIAHEEPIVQQAKKSKPSDDDFPIGNPLGFQDIFQDKADNIGTADPVRDFNEMVNRRDIDLVDKAIEQMKDTIQKLIKESIHDQYYKKCYDCLIELRKGCIREEESTKFNAFLRDLKRQYGSSSNRRHEFWKDYVVDKNCTLISSEEAVDIDDVTSQDARDFLHKEPTNVCEVPIETAELAGDEDLFGDLE